MSSPLYATVEIAFNRYLAMDPDSPRRLEGMAGRTVAVELKGPELTLYMLFDDGGVRVFDAIEGEPDTALRGSPFDLMRLAREGAAGAGAVEIRGDVDLARRFEKMLGEVDIDWEEQLAGITGDVIAHHVGSALRGLLGWGEKARASMERNVGDYLREESRLNPRRDELDTFVRGVDTLRNDAERLEARIGRLEK